MIKKILIDARMYGLENAGIGRYLINLIDNLRVIDKENRYILLLRKKYFNELNLPNNWKKVEADYKHYTFSEQFKLPLVIKKEKPDLVHFPHLNIPVFWKGKFVLTVHDLIMQRQGVNATVLPLPVYYLKRVPFLFTSRIAVKNAQKIITPSEVVKKDVVNYYPVKSDKIKVIYEGVTAMGKIKDYQLTISKLQKKYKVQKPYFIYVGNAYPHKNLKMAIEATILLNRKMKNRVMFVIGGSKDDFKSRLHRQIRELRAEEFVRLVGYIPEQELSLLYQHSSGFIYPSLSEGFGLQGLEAISAGTLLLASDIAVFREIYKDLAFYFDPTNVESIEASMNYILNLGQDKRNRFVKKSLEYIKRYSWQKMAKETLEIYTKAYEENL